MNKIEKFLSRLTSEERGRVAGVVESIISGEYTSYDLKRLKGYKNVYRIRIGTIRIVFIEHGNDRRILTIERRNEGTYRGLLQ